MSGAVAALDPAVAALGGAPAAAAPAGGASTAATPPAAPAAADPAAQVSKAAAALAAFRAKRAAPPADPAAPAAPAAVPAPGTPPAAAPAPAIPADIADSARRWAEHVKAEAARIATLAEGLSDEDKALLSGISDVALRAKVLDRLRGATVAEPAKVPAKPRPAGGPPSASAVDFGSTLKDPRAMSEAKAKDPAGFAAFMSSALSRAGRKSTLDGAAKRGT